MLVVISTFVPAVLTLLTVVCGILSFVVPVKMDSGVCGVLGPAADGHMSLKVMQLVLVVARWCVWLRLEQYEVLTTVLGLSVVCVVLRFVLLWFRRMLLVLTVWVRLMLLPISRGILVVCATVSRVLVRWWWRLVLADPLWHRMSVMLLLTVVLIIVVRCVALGLLWAMRQILCP